MLTRFPQQTQPLRLRSAGVLVGLLAATLGAINALVGVASGATRLEAVSAGVAETVITTAVALLVVIPALWMYHQLRDRRGRD